MKTYTKIIAAVAAGLACTAATSQAALTSLTPGTGATISTATLAGGVLFATTGPLAYSFGGGLDTGTVTTSVYTGVTANTLGGLTFVYTIAVTAGDISAIGLNTFNLPSVLVGDLTGQTDPSDTSSYAGGTVNFNWLTALVAGTSPSTVIVGTSAPADEVGVGDLLDTHPGGSVSILAPVPEPTTVAAGALMLLPFGVGALRSLRKDRIA
jgi:hypothetical protein